MDFHFPINKMLSKTLASMAKHSEETLHRNNSCILALKETIILSNRDNLLTLKASLIEFTQREAQRNFPNKLISLYVQLIDQHLKKKPIG
jgi:hypothetical protein